LSEAIILAGGFGTRLRAVVSDVPKPMAPVAGKPFLAWQMECLAAAGVTRFILSVGFQAETIQKAFGDSFAGCAIAYAHETEPLGTGGAIRLALSYAQESRVFVLNGDSLCDLDLQALRLRVGNHARAIGIGVKHVPDAGRYGAVRFDETTGVVTTFAEKDNSGAGWINAGVYDVSADFFSGLTLSESAFSFEKEILQKDCHGGLVAQPAGAFFIDIGIPADYARAQTEIPAWVKGRGK
jgi:D-glycero-alpha-D-manno-heptose 1-phosphate guanylyltransferase